LDEAMERSIPLSAIVRAEMTWVSYNLQADFSYIFDGIGNNYFVDYIERGKPEMVLDEGLSPFSLFYQMP
jgi:hypothetical protein